MFERRGPALLHKAACAMSLILAACMISAAAHAQAGNGFAQMPDAAVTARVQQLVKSQKKADSPFMETKGYWPRSIQVDAYEFMLQIEIEGRGALIEPLYVAHFGSRKVALERLAETAEMTQRPREAQQLREKLQLLKSPAPQGSKAPGSGAPEDFAALAALARNASDAGDLAQGEEVARRALQAWTDAKLAGRTPKPGADIIEVRSLLADAAILRGDILAAADLLRQNVIEATQGPLQEVPNGSPFKWTCASNLSSVVTSAVRFRQSTGAIALDGATLTAVRECLAKDAARYVEDSDAALSYGQVSLQLAIESGEAKEAAEAVRRIISATKWRRPAFTALALGAAYDELSLASRQAWIKPLLPAIRQVIAPDRILQIAATDDYGLELGQLAPVAILLTLENHGDAASRLEAALRQAVASIQKRTNREFDVCLSVGLCDYLALVAERGGDAAAVKTFMDRALGKYGADFGTGTGIAGYTEVTREALRLGKLYECQGRWQAARAVYEVALNSSKMSRDGAPDYLMSTRTDAWIGLAKAQARVGEPAAALAITSKFFTQLRAQLDRTGGLDGDLTLRWSGRLRELLGLHLALLSGLPEADRASRAEDAFLAAQYLQLTTTASTTQKLAARLQAPDARIQQLVRKHQDLRLQLVSAHRRLSLSTETDRAEASARITSIETALATATKDLLAKYPAYLQAVRLDASRAGDVRSSLRENEALVLLLETSETGPGGPFRFLVSRDGVAWSRAADPGEPIASEVAALRCGLDATAWRGEGAKQCADLLKADPATVHANALPFDVRRANALYEILLGGLEREIKDKTLLVVASGDLAAIPLHVLVTKPAAPAGSALDLKDVAWLAREHAIAVLPAVASLTALRRKSTQPSAGEAPYIGFGDPVLAGQPRCGKIIVPEQCPSSGPEVVADAESAPRSATSTANPVGLGKSGLADPAVLRTLCPLPDTAHELACVAQSLSARPDAIVLRGNMTETSIKKAPLSRYRIVHFATHGLLAGETARLAGSILEPALVLTPPTTPTEIDDGLLTASEISLLKLDADWVILSACNTAAGGAPGGETLSGLAQSFFYSGARALLVSHWPVNSYAATRLTTATFAELRHEPTLGRAEAFRRAMVALMDDGSRKSNLHPAVWAPFVVVGEDGALAGSKPRPAAAGTAEPPPRAPAPAAQAAPSSTERSLTDDDASNDGLLPWGAVVTPR